MNRNTNLFMAGAVLSFALAVCHIAVVALSLGGYLFPMLVVAAIWVLIGLGLLREWRWLAFVAFLAALAGGILAMGQVVSLVGLVQFGFGLVLLVNCLIAVVLFILLWRNEAKTDPLSGT